MDKTGTIYCRQVLTGVTLHPNIVCFFFFFLGAGVAKAKYVSSRLDSGMQGDAVL